MLPINSKSLAAVVFAVMSSLCASAQQAAVPAKIQVMDQSGAVIPSAALAVVPSFPGPEVDEEADQNGTVTLGLTPGSYRVSIKSPGFSTLTKELDVLGSGARTVQFALRVATGGGPNVITASAPILNPAQAVLAAMLPDGPGSALRISAAPDHAKTFDLAALKAMPHKTISFHNVHTNADETYSGVPLIDLLASLGIPHGKELHGKGLSDYIVATGSDGYKAVLALAEVDPEFHPGDVIVADTMDGKPLDAKNGPFKLVVTEDKRPARSVHGLVSIEVKAAE
jgi:hypothetical protein